MRHYDPRSSDRAVLGDLNVPKLYVLAAVGKKQISQYIDEDGIHFPDLIEVAAPWSTSEKGMITLLGNCSTAVRLRISGEFIIFSDGWGILGAVSPSKQSKCGITLADD